MRKWMIVLGIVIAAGAAAGFYFTRQQTEQSSADPVPTRTVQATRGSIETKVSGSGMVGVAQESNVKAAYKGTVSKINFKVGDKVKKGQTIVEFKKTDNSEKIKQTELSLKKQQLQMEQLQKQYKEAAEESRDSIRINIESLTLEIEQNETTIASLRKEEAENHDVAAPVAGTVTASEIEVGGDVNENTVVAVIVDYTNLEFTMSADELDVPKIKAGQTAEVTLNAFPDNVFTGKINTIANEGKSSNGVATYEVKIGLSNAAGVLSGMSGQAEIVTNAKQDVVLVPVEAVVAMGGKHFVRVPGDGGASAGAPNAGELPSQRVDDAQDGAQAEPAGDGSDAGSMDGRAAAGTGGGNAAGGNTGSSNRSGTRGNSGNRAAGSSAGNEAAAGQENDGAIRRMGQASGGTLREVTVGISNDSYAEIISGLSEGDSVILAAPQGKAGGSTEQRQQIRGMGGGIIGGGSFSGGAFPAGGGGGRR
ncbi:efflux RND transporter periplasmic adaptor subunit [Paenibacillus apiarius]|uniref:efflux RND transporter periplasmic adaptor subunit n=1 Tax=Paenibacillus apiarius TaxID=46240 RepID=UPI0019811B64|nr:efflux RND transporter periplasmic adaptor subunit [Paenibacillus apiarius]MBN3524937.1 efflux RND transporter periplasmic adaptor subunit [Paenibacillus apiarius]